MNDSPNTTLLLHATFGELQATFEFRTRDEHVVTIGGAGAADFGLPPPLPRAVFCFIERLGEDLTLQPAQEHPVRLNGNTLLHASRLRPISELSIGDVQVSLRVEVSHAARASRQEDQRGQDAPTTLAPVLNFEEMDAATAYVPALAEVSSNPESPASGPIPGGVQSLAPDRSAHRGTAEDEPHYGAKTEVFGSLVFDDSLLPYEEPPKSPEAPPFTLSTEVIASLPRVLAPRDDSPRTDSTEIVTVLPLGLPSVIPETSKLDAATAPRTIPPDVERSPLAPVVPIVSTASRKPPVRTLVLAGLAVAATVLAYCSVRARGPQEDSPSVASAKPQATSTSQKPTSENKISAPMPKPNLPPASEQGAANALFHGQYDEALEHYRTLAAAHPDNPAFGKIASILEKRQAPECAQEKRPGCPEVSQ